MTSAPAPANDKAMASPIPRLAPVTSAVFPFRSSILSMVQGRALLAAQHGARGCVRRQISEDELDRTQHHLRQRWSLKKCGCMPHGAIENAAFAVALDPNQSVVLIGADMPGAEVCLVGINADQNMQFVARIGAIGQEVIELVRVDETFSAEVRGERAACELFGERAVGIVDFQRCGLGAMRSSLRADQLAELRNIP